MPAATPTAADLAAGAGNRYLAGLLMALVAETPLFNSFPAYDMVGTHFMSLALGAVPAAGGFVDLNEGFLSSKVQLVMGRTEAKRLGALIESAKSATDLWNSTHGPEFNWMDIQIKQRLLSEIQNLEKVMVLGTGHDAKGFLGMKQLTPPTTANTLTLTAVPGLPYTKSFLNVGGTAANTASSVYSVCHGPMDAGLYMGGPGGVAGFLDMSEIVEQYQADPGDAARKQKYYLTDGEGYVGLAIMGSSEAAADRKYAQYSLRRAGNITEDAGKTCTESVLDKLIAMHPAGHKPHVFYMSARSQLQLLADRIANSTVHVIGGSSPGSKTVRAELPTEHRGIPIIVCEHAITDDQAIETVA